MSDAERPPVPAVEINDNHRRSITAAFRYIDGLLADAESTAAGSRSPFSRFYPDLDPPLQGLLADYVARLRGQMLAFLERLGVRVDPPRTAASWSIQTALSFARVSIQEISPQKLAGYGPLDEHSVAALESLEADLDRTLRRMQNLLARRPGGDMATRLDRLERTPVNLELLRALQRVIAARGLIEFQGTLEALVERLESNDFEIAFFGRVSSGKSSLLNTILGFEALPVGVTPVTSVPTRVTWGAEAVAEIRFADGREENLPLDRLAEYVSEGGNPENRKRVARASVRIPSSRLRANVVFVDTPGVGSLATSGERQSYSYLPRCDFGVLLLAASGAPAPGDLEILRLLDESGIPASVVISKADQVSEGDRERLREYVRSAVASHVGLEIPVSLVSTVGPSRELARSWFEREIAPRVARGREQAELSARRKLASLREGVAASLRVAIGSPSDEISPAAAEGAAARVENMAIEAERAIREVAARCERLADDVRSLGRPLLAATAREFTRLEREEGGEATPGRVLENMLGEATRQVRDRIRSELTGLRDRLRDLLLRMAKELPGSAVNPEELTIDLVTLPSLAMPPEVQEIELTTGGRLWPLTALRERRVEAELLAGLEEPVSRELTAFGRRLRDWLLAATSGFAERFAAQSEPLRGRARRSKEAPAVDDPFGLARDLAEIEGAARPEPVVTAGG